MRRISRTEKIYGGTRGGRIESGAVAISFLSEYQQQQQHHRVPLGRFHCNVTRAARRTMKSGLLVAQELFSGVYIPRAGDCLLSVDRPGTNTNNNNKKVISLKQEKESLSSVCSTCGGVHRTHMALLSKK